LSAQGSLKLQKGWKICMVILKLKEADLRAQHAALKDVLTDEYKL
jgi:hypothetical protein